MSEDFRTKRALAADRVRHAIRTGRFQPGDRLRQSELARDLGLSSTPVREALTELQASGLVVHESHRGVRVASLDLPRIQQVYAARKIIEGQTARLAFDHATNSSIQVLGDLASEMDALYKRNEIELLMTADELFHLNLIKMSENPFLVKAARDLWNSFPRYFMWNIGDRIKKSISEHKMIVEALRRRNHPEFVQITEEHMEGSLLTILDHLSSLRQVKDS